MNNSLKKYNYPAGVLAIVFTVLALVVMLFINGNVCTADADDPLLEHYARENAVLLNRGSASENNTYLLHIEEPDGLYIFQPKASFTSFTVNGVKAEKIGYPDKNILSLEKVKNSSGDYEIHFDDTIVNRSYTQSFYIGTLQELNIIIQSQYFSRFFVTGGCICLCLLSLCLYIGKKSERYLIVIFVYTLLRTFSTVEHSILQIIFSGIPQMQHFAELISHSQFRSWLNLAFFTALEFLALKSFATIKVGRVHLAAVAEIAVLTELLPDSGVERAYITLAMVAIVWGCFFISLLLMDRKKYFYSVMLAAALAIQSAIRIFTRLYNIGIIPDGKLELEMHLAAISTLVYPLCFFMCACIKFAGKFREADELNTNLEEKIRENIRQHTLFIRSMLHNLKTPLFSLSGYSDMAAATLPENAEQSARYIQKISENAKYVGHLLDQLMLLTRMDDGQITYNFINVNLSNLIKSVYDSTLIEAQKKNISIKTDVPEKVYISADALYLQQSIQNIADNAVIHTREGGEITISAEQLENGGCSLRISDNGCGISKEDLPKIFERYYSNRHGGRSSSGLGLTIAKLIIEAGGGSISVESTEGEGTEFTIVLAPPDNDEN